METSTLSLRNLISAAAVTGLFLAGCVNDPSSAPADDSDTMTATFQGRVQGDAAMGKRSASEEASGYGIEGATVTLMRIKADGSLEAAASAEVKTDAQGRFSLHSLQAAGGSVRELIVMAKKDGKEWKAVVSAKAENGDTVICRPLNTESSVEADVLAKVRAGSGTAAVSFADIATHLDAALSLQASGKADVEAYLAAQIQAEARARDSVWIASTGITSAQIGKANEARMDAEARLEAALDASVDLSAEAQAKIDSDFHAAEFKAWTDAGIVLADMNSAHEASYQAMLQINAQATIAAETKTAWMHKIETDLDILIAPAFTLSGTVEGGISGAVVQVATIKADGSLEVLTDVTAQTDAQGGFTLNTAATLPDSVVVVVTKDESKLMVLLDSAVTATADKPVQVDAQTTVEVAAILAHKGK